VLVSYISARGFEPTYDGKEKIIEVFLVLSADDGSEFGWVKGEERIHKHSWLRNFHFFWVCSLSSIAVGPFAVSADICETMELLLTVQYYLAGVP
jgi:hypothetical protein